MNHTPDRSLRHVLLAAVVAAGVLAPAAAGADVVLRAEGPGPRRYYDTTVYPVEIEPHFSFGAADVYGPAGFGGGLRVGVPFAYGRVGYAPDNFAITFGGDILHYDNCFGADCGANYLMLPVAAQWNVFVARRVSLFAEAGAFLYKGWFDGCVDPGCGAPSDFGVLPTVALGGRVHVGPVAALTLRIGYPMSTLGVSFM